LLTRIWLALESDAEKQLGDWEVISKSAIAILLPSKKYTKYLNINYAPSIITALPSKEVSLRQSTKNLATSERDMNFGKNTEGLSMM